MKISIIQQRYGKKVLGGAETLGALIARLLAPHHQVEILTTTAADYDTWENVYPPGTTAEDGFQVRRFPVQQGRTPEFHRLSDVIHLNCAAGEFPLLNTSERDQFLRRLRNLPDGVQEKFIHAQGPIAPGIDEHLRRNQPEAALFLTYLYPTTYDGLLAVPSDRANIVPTLHDEIPAYLPVFGRRISRARILCCTNSEIALAARLYPDTPLRIEKLGYGLDLPKDEVCPPKSPPFLLYAGRIDDQKGIPDLIKWYLEMRELLPDPPRLVLIGGTSPQYQSLPGVAVRGFVSEEEKLELMRTALAFVHPSPFESLGIVLLEALACRTPIIVTKKSEVMVEHCRESQAGLWIENGAELAAITKRLSSGDLRRELGDRGRRWVESEYSIESYTRRLLQAFPISAPPSKA
jgi:glycosyltransferase involved in cell wall biosynthesis